ncbi:hypothetical protein MWH25_06580 [Natroniella acetigena]|uniref:hypothetical protein n=1 Tax=Natroniella acetigena TaxID=52004 RepID=UPI00200A14FD|nr:hypothetical protein [Natroniella acetigena]MCK8827409.1 hypothetical protein [Natroniella acetigena]
MEEVSFVSENFVEVYRNIIPQEEVELKKSVLQFKIDEQSGQGKWLKNIWNRIVNLFKI